MPTPTPINIAQKPQLLVDNHVIEYVNFVTRVMHQPTKYADNPIVKADKPWEITNYFRTNTWNIHWDEREEIYKLWYEDMAWDYDQYMRLERSGAGRQAAVLQSLLPPLLDAGDLTLRHGAMLTRP